MRQGRFSRPDSSSGESKRSEVDQIGSSSHPKSDSRRDDRSANPGAARPRASFFARVTTGFSPRRLVSVLGLVGVSALSVLTPACHEFDTTRDLPPRGSVGEEMFGVICDRVASQALREDLSGASFRSICHKPAKGEFGDKVETLLLPPIDPEAYNAEGNLVKVDKQQKDRAKAVGRVEALARRRTDLIRALDATFPEQKVPSKDIDNGDEGKSCNALKREALLTDQLADMMGRMGDLYNDGTLPNSTQSLSRVVDAFRKSDEAQKAWARISARQGYRPIETALGAARPVVAYPNLRDFSNASLRLLSADSNPYERDPKRDDEGRRIPVPGPGNAAMNKMLETAHEELLTVKADPKLAPLVVTNDAVADRSVLSRPRDNLEMLEQILFASDPAFGGGAPQFIVRRDARGFARISGGSVPAPFVDSDNDGLPDVDAVGRFRTTNDSLAPSPFPYPGSPAGTRDEFGRAKAGERLLYDYIDTSHTFAAQMMADMKPLVNPDPKANHETLMDMMGGMPIMMGPRELRTKAYDNGTKVEFDGIRTKDSPMLDLVHAMGVILGDRTTDQTLAMASKLFTDKPKELARVTGAINTAYDIAAKYPNSKIPTKSTFWDEGLAIMAQLAKEPGLLEDLMRALATPEAQDLGNIFAKFARFKDEISYNRNDLNGPAWNVTTNSTAELKTPVDNAQPRTGKNRGSLSRFLQLIADGDGVATCNKADAVVHASLGGLDVDMPPLGSYKECEVFKIDNLAAFYVDVIARAWEYEPDTKVAKRGTFYLRPDLLREGIVGIGAATTGLMENSSGITGFISTGNNRLLSPSPQWVNRLVFFDTQGDTVNEKTRRFVADLQDFSGTNTCPERVIDDPNPGAPDANADGKVHGLRNCPRGSHLQERDANTIFVWEHFGFYDAMRPIAAAFAKHGREDLFLALSSAAHRHFPGQDATPDECRLANGVQCPRDGMNSYEPLVAEAFAGDLFAALGELVKALDTLAIKRCDEQGANGVCAKMTNVSGIDVAAAAARSMLDPDYAKAQRMTDRHGSAATKRNDGTPVAQVTPAYLLTNALHAIDLAFDAHEEQHPEENGDRRRNWRRARSQLVDQFLGVNGIQTNATFRNPAIPKMTPVIVDVVRGQLLAHCPKSFAPPYEKCAWATDELVQKATDTLGGPLVGSGIDVMDALRKDPEGRRQMEMMMQYLLDEGSKNDALASVLASSNDMIQLLRDEENMVPLFKVVASAMDASIKDAKGHVTQASLVDAQMALLARVSGKYFDEEGKEICAKEIDPNQVLAVALGHLVTPIKDGDFKGQTPLEVIIDVIADVNREDPTEKYEGTLEQKDYASVSDNVVDFLINKERGLEQFYEVIRQGTKF